MNIVYISIVCLTLLLFIVAFLIKSNKKLKKANQKIAEDADLMADQNEEILMQFEEIKRKNTELNQYKIYLEKLDKKKTIIMNSALEKAKESERLKSSLLSNIYHEIRTPLNAIMGFTQLLSIEEDIKNINYINIIEKNAEDLLVLVDNVIELSKMQIENLVPSNTDIPVKNFLEKIYKETQSIRNTKGKNNIDIKLSLNGLDDNDTIKTDKTKLYKVMKHLLDNALKYTIEGSITIAYDKKNTYSSFKICDTGIGIEQDKLLTIFSAFHKIEDHNNLHRGMGIGLAIAKNLSTQIKGDIKVESEIKKGTKFTLKIPDIAA